MKITHPTNAGNMNHYPRAIRKPRPFDPRQDGCGSSNLKILVCGCRCGLSDFYAERVRVS